MLVTSLVLSCGRGKDTASAPPFLGEWVKTDVYVNGRAVETGRRMTMLRLGRDAFQTTTFDASRGQCMSGGTMRATDSTLTMNIAETTCPNVVTNGTHRFRFSLSEEGKRLTLLMDMEGRTYREVYVRHDG